MKSKYIINFVLALSLTIFSILIVPAPQAEAVVPGNNGKILFEIDDDIYTIEADGSNMTRLTNNSINDNEASWSPDGKRIVFSSDRDIYNEELYIMNADGSNVTRLTNNSAIDREPRWSPDGTKLLFMSDRDHSEYELYTMDVNTANVTRLTTNITEESAASWSPDGTKIVFATDRDGDLEIYSMNSDGTNPLRLTNSAGADYTPAWSPDGTKIAFSSIRDGDNEIYVMNASNGSSVTALTTNSIPDGGPAWSPSGTKIAFESALLGAGTSQIYTMNSSNGGNLTRVTTTNDIHAVPDWQSYVRLPVHRFYNFKQNVHFYTINQAEATHVYNTMAGTYRYEGVANYALEVQAQSTLPVHRFYNFKQNVHFYTINQAEATHVYNTMAGTYRYEGVAYYSYTSQVAGTGPVHRFYNFKQNVHFYTSNQAEATHVYNTMAGTYRYEGVAFYNFTSGD